MEMQQRRPVLLKLMMLGDSGVGKTALITQYLNKRFSEEHDPLAIGGFVGAKKLCVGACEVTLQVRGHTHLSCTLVAALICMKR